MGVLDQHREIRVLIVDDSPADVRLLVEAFREVEASVNIRIAKDGAQALMMLYAGPGQDHWARPIWLFLTSICRRWGFQ
jgi:CheY-like chemotaxis protein